MKRIILFACLLMTSAPGFAGMRDIVAADNQFTVSYLSTDVDYTETGNGIFGTQTGTLDTETGPVPGYGVAVSVMTGPAGLYGRAEYDRTNGSTTYTGAFQGGQFGSLVSTSSATLTDYSGRFGVGVALDEDALLIPYAELGHHQWDRGVNFGETYSHSYVGIGVLGQYSPAPSAVLSVGAMLGQTMGSYIIVNGGPGFTGFSDALGDSVMSRFSLAGDYAFTQVVHGGIALDYTSFKYGMSAVHTGVLNGVNVRLWEPDSATHYTTIKLSIGVAL